MGISVSVIEAAVSADREELHVEAGEIAVDGGAFGTGHGQVGALLRVLLRAGMLWIGGPLWRRVLMRDGGALGHGVGGCGMLGALVRRHRFDVEMIAAGLGDS